MGDAQRSDTEVHIVQDMSTTRSMHAALTKPRCVGIPTHLDQQTADNPDAPSQQGLRERLAFPVSRETAPVNMYSCILVSKAGERISSACI